MKEKGKHTAVLAISEIDETTISDARKKFLAYKKKDIIMEGLFDDDRWGLCDEYAKYHLDFRLDSERFEEFGSRMKLTEKEYKEYMKTFIMCQMGELAIVSLQKLVNNMKKVSYCKGEEIYKIFENAGDKSIGRLSDFYSTIPEKGREEELMDLMDRFDEAEEYVRSGMSGGQRSLATFESYFRFNEIIKMFWQESKDEEEKLFFFPIWLWWNVSAILPLRPREFVLTPRNCLTELDGKYYLTVRRNRIKGSGKTKSYKINNDYENMRYQIPKKLADEIQWYLNKTKNYRDTDIHTLFITATHYAMWERSAPYTSRYFTYINLRTCLRYFFEMIVQDRYGYKILFENDSTTISNEKEIEYLHLGDTRHIALINMIAEGATPMVAMMLAGHDNPEMSSHYYSNITTLIECRTYRQYKKLIKGKQNYAISGPQAKLKSKEFTLLEDGSRCYSEKIINNDFSDCYKVLGPAGEIGFCKNCTYHRDEGKTFQDSKDLYKNRIVQECLMLEEIVKKVRSGKGEPEDIMSVLLRLRDSDYSYQQYLLEKMGEDYGKEKNN
ncbi:MAG: hypothetical protein PUF29_08615 [Anaerobutyricum hallii]|uniref:hypothetical protein n=1 Tax=Anaerobutyricum hallii TaxID=39488 RepID=UPI002430E833|nr:hypothetical protein [Anaerobutyricum hallii]MDD6588646.1 hypothetical protein [Anaerobutyricum hallii]